MPEVNGVEYEDYKGYIIAPGIQMPSYDIYEYEIFESLEAFKAGNPVHASESDTEAKQWIDREEHIHGSLGEFGAPGNPRAKVRLFYDDVSYGLYAMDTVTYKVDEVVLRRVGPPTEMPGNAKRLSPDIEVNVEYRRPT